MSADFGEIYFFWRPKHRLSIFMHTIVCKKCIRMQSGWLGREALEPHRNGQN